MASLSGAQMLGLTAKQDLKKSRGLLHQPVLPHILLPDSREAPLCVDWCVQWLTEHAVLHVVLSSGHLSSHHIALWLPALFVAAHFSLFCATDLPAFWVLCVSVLNDTCYHTPIHGGQNLQHVALWDDCKAELLSLIFPRLKSSSFSKTLSQRKETFAGVQAENWQ